MERETNPQSTVLCRMGCGFYGNPAFEGMCSKCYKDSLKRKQPSPPLSGRASPNAGSSSGMTTVVSSPQPCPASGAPTTIAIPKIDTETTTSIHSTCGASAAAALSPDKNVQLDTDDSELNTSSQSLPSGSEVTESPDGKSKKRNRCTSCRKKVGLTGFECRCGGLFCGLHRYSDKHSCSYDYKADAREMIAKQNPVVVGEKVKKI